MKMRTAETVERDDIICALVEERPYTSTELAQLLGVSGGVPQQCARLARAGRLDRLPDGRWTIARGLASPAPAGAPVPPRRRPAPARIETPDEDPLALIEDIDDDLDVPLPPERDECAPTPPHRAPPRRGRGIEVTPRAMRQPHERPPSMKVKPDPAWWESAPRAGFTDLARSHAERMRNSREHFQIKPRILE